MITVEINRKAPLKSVFHKINLALARASRDTGHAVSFSLSGVDVRRLVVRYTYAENVRRVVLDEEAN